MRSATTTRIRQEHILGISIHALHAERDSVCVAFVVLPDHISIHALHAERDAAIETKRRWLRDFNPRAPCGARPGRKSQ